jgi:hypothetical protein
MAKFLGGSLQPGVSQQLTARSQYLKDDKYADGLSALHGNSPFINLYSSVVGSDYSAQTFKLEGGLAFSDDKLVGDPVGYKLTAAGDDERLFTPRPGIIDAKVKTKGTFGALKDVEISVKAYNVGDFDIIYDLYCRPGFSFLLEWGHTVYLDSDSRGQQTMQSREVAQSFMGGNKYEDIMATIRTVRGNTSYNYDAIVAICKNFSWTFNADGTYDINLMLISKGEVIESIKTSFDPGMVEKSAANLAAGFNDKSERKSLLHFFCKRIELSAADGELKGQAVLSALSGAGKASGLASLLKAEDMYVATAPGFDIKSPTSFFDDKTTFIYISLRTILALLNTSMMWVGNDQRAVKFKTQPGTTGYNGFFTHPWHHSINPFVCVTPNLNPFNSFWESKPAGKALHPGISALTPQDDVLNICVSNLYLYEKLDSIYDDDQAIEKQPGVLDVLKTILGGVGEALGGINEFDVSYDEDTDEWCIVDRKCKIKGDAINAIKEIDLIGLGSFAYDIKTESKITNKLASQVSIAAQASGTGTKQNVAEMLQWNRGHSDRIFPRKNEGPKPAPPTGETAAEKDAKTEWNDRCKEAFEKFNGTGWFTDQQYDPDLFKGIQSGHQKYQSILVPMICGKEGMPAPGTIPVELSFTLHGIAGFRIGEVFKLSANSMKILPRSYSNASIGFIITRTDHSIGDGGWKTEVGALMYNIAPAPKVDTAALANFSASGGTAQPQTKPVPKDEGTPVDPNATDKLQNQTALGTNVSYDKVKAAVERKKYRWYSGELELNIVGVRNTAGQISDGAGGVKHPLTNRFTDVVIVAWKEGGKTFAESYPATTVPGASWSLSTNRKFNASKGNANGVGIMREKQFIDQYTPGMHHGGSASPHLALRSVSGQSAHRDKNYSDNWLHLAVTPVGKLSAAPNLAGLFSDGGGMQLHNSGASTAANKTVDNWSAGCQVFANQKQHNRLMELVGKSQKATKKNKFSYVLLNSKEISL